MYSKKLLLSLCHLMAVVTVAHIHATTWIVDPTPTGTYKTIQDAYDVANSGDTILLTANHTYTGNGNVKLDFNKTLTLGRTGIGSDPIIDMEGSITNTGRFCTVEAGNTLRLHNLVIQNGYEDYGGAILIESSGAGLFYNCIFLSNTATSSAWISAGGAIFSYGSLKVFSSTFSGNSAPSQAGGAIYSYLGSTNLDSCEFYSNTSRVGGAIENSGNHYITGCTFKDNQADAGAGAVDHSNGIMYLTDCIFNNNSTTGALSYGGAVLNDARMYINGCTFNNNSAVNTGGALVTFNYGVTVACSRFKGNSATLGSAIYRYSGTAIATNCWWGSNQPNAAALFGGSGVGYLPYIVINLLPDPLTLTPCESILITADFTKNSSGDSSGCDIFENSPVLFSATDGSLTVTHAYVTDGAVSTTLYDIQGTNTFFTLCLTVDAGSESAFDLCNTATPTGIYVSSYNGNDSNIGSIDYPVKTIKKGIELATTCSLALHLEAGSTFIGDDNTNLTINHTISFGKYHAGANPIIDMQNEVGRRFCIINAGTTVTISNLVIQNGNVTDNGGAIENNGILQATGSTFNHNHAVYGGALYNNGTTNVACCRFIGNSATHGSAIYRFSGTVTATDCWWGTNYPNTSTLFDSTVTYDPYLVINLLPEPLEPCTAAPTVITADFTRDNNGDPCGCTDYFNGSVGFSATAGSLTSTLSPLVNGQAATTIYNVPYGSFTLCAYTDADLSTTYAYCQTATPGGAIFVSPSGNDSNPGTQASPVRTIAQGITLAATTTCQVLLLEAGTTFTGTGNNNLTISTNNITIGRYGAGADPIIDMQNVSGYQFCTINAGITVTMHNLLIKNGNIPGSGGAISLVGTLYAYSCTFSHNSAANGSGGGINCSGVAIITTCTFSYNSATNGDGGAINNSGNVANKGMLTITNSRFNNNTSNSNGGAIANRGNIASSGIISATNCTFSHNSASLNGGALYNWSNTVGGSIATVTNCIFNNNSVAATAGGAIRNYGASVGAGMVDVIGCTFYSNSAPTGGAIQNQTNGTVSVTCSRFASNTATNANAIYSATRTVTAANCWWDTNYPNATTLFGSTLVTYMPYIVINLLPDPLWPRISCASPIVADFTQNSSGETHGCTIMNGTPVIFSTTAGTITPTSSSFVNGQAEATLTGIPNTTPFSVCAKTDTDISTGYNYCETATPTDLTEIWVSALDGNDTNLGNSSSNPVKTISRGLERLSCVSTGTVYLYLEEGNTFTGTGNKDLTITLSTLSISPYTGSHGTANPIINMEGDKRFCIINSGIHVTMSNLFIQNGNVVSDGGGAIFNYGTLTALSCTFSNNSATIAGGAIVNAGLATDSGILNATNCIFNGNTATVGGVISNTGAATDSGILNATTCSFSNNSATIGGVILNIGATTDSGILNATTCIFNGNTATVGGVLYNGYITSSGTSVIECCRFIDNTATASADTIYNALGTVTATNCWWGTKYPDAANLFGGTAVTYEPYIVINLLPEPLWPRLICASSITADFTHSSDGTLNGCSIMNGTPVIFSANSLDVTISPTLSYVVNGQAQTTLSDIPNTNPFSLCAQTDTDLSTTGYTYCETATPTDLTVVYVSALDGNDDNLGNSPSNPVKTIQRGIERFSCVSTGTLYLYLEEGNTFTGTGNKDLTITLSNLSISPYTGSHGTANPIIDMEGDKRFCIIDLGCTVTMSNLVIQNGNVGLPNEGAGILNNGTLTALSCTFSNNSATGGGAIESFGTLTALSCIFSNNRAANDTDGEGGAIASYGTSNATGCIFSNNYANNAGGAILNAGTSNATGCIFSNNTVGNNGGAILNAGTSINSCCRFIGNHATISADAISNVAGTVNATNCWWNTNAPDQAALFGGTAVTYEPYIVINLLPDPLLIKIGAQTIVTADFTKNNDGSTNGCTVMNGMPVIFSATAPITISPTLSIVVDGQATTTAYDSSVTYSFLFCATTDTDFSATGYTYCETATLHEFTTIYVSALHGNDNNSGESPSDPVKTIAHGLEQLSHVATVPLHLYLEAGNTFTGTGNKNLTVTLSNLTITKYIDVYGPADPIIDMESASGLTHFCTTDSGITVTMSNLVIQNGHAYQGGAIINDGTLYVSDCTFSNNKACCQAGAIYNTGILHITDCMFYANIHLTTGCAVCVGSAGGGALFNEGFINASNCSFIDNSFLLGGAMYNNGGTAILTDCLFSGNNATDASSAGGAIYTKGLILVRDNKNVSSDTLYINNTTFANNNALLYGGAIYNEDDVVFLTGCTFLQNDAPNGGAFANRSIDLQTTVSGQSCVFIGNSAEQGGALYNEGESADAIIHCSRLVDNTATINGDAIFNAPDSPTVEAQDNWWGSNNDPSPLVYGDVDVDPQITVTLTAIPLGEGNFTIIATFSTSCIPDGTPVEFSTTAGDITPTATVTNNGIATAQLTDLLDVTGTVCITIGPEAERFTLCIQVQGTAREYRFLENSTVNISTGARAIYALDWCQAKPGTLEPPLLAAGGAIDNTSCSQPNIFVYSLANICEVDDAEPINPRIFTITDGTFDSNVVNSVEWCCDNNAACPLFPYLAVGGKASTDSNSTNAHVYIIDPKTYTLESYADASTNGFSSVTAVSWNPGSKCKILTVGGCQQDPANLACNIIAYKNQENGLVEINHTLFDTNVTSLEWCKPYTAANAPNRCAYLAVGVTGTTPCEGGFDMTNQIAVYKGSFGTNNGSTAPCGR